MDMISEMIRTFIQVPTNQEEWDNLPQEFNDYLDNLNEARIKLSDSQVVDPLYPSYDYEWELDEEIPFTTILLYWNDLNKELPNHQKILDEINECMAETSYYDYISSFYSY
jgi:hypothetical protein